MSEGTEEQPEKTVLASRLGGGPHGLGDPDDRSLRKLEKDVLIPKKIREISRREHCAKEVSAFQNCAGDNGVMMVFRCREQNDVMKECLGRWFFDEGLIGRCTEEYLNERSEFRRTGLSQKERKAQAAQAARRVPAQNQNAL